MTIVSELPEKRGIDTIQFRLNNGSISAAVYSYPVHEKDAVFTPSISIPEGYSLLITKSACL